MACDAAAIPGRVSRLREGVQPRDCWERGGEGVQPDRISAACASATGAPLIQPTLAMLARDTVSDPTGEFGCLPRIATDRSLTIVGSGETSSGLLRMRRWKHAKQLRMALAGAALFLGHAKKKSRPVVSRAAKYPKGNIALEGACLS